MTQVYLEIGAKRTFAMALDWPGWGRSGRTAEEALEALAEYATRYAPVAKKAGLTVDATFDVVESLPGNATTDFGAPAAFATADSEPVPAAAAKRTAALVEACWDTLTRVAARSPEELRKGPRGGGRDRDKMLTHVVESEAAYGRKIGVKHKPPALDDKAAIKAMRADLIAVLGAPSDGTPPVPNGWPVAYTARRIAWHALDHAWEMQDRRS
ncbi:hypothetical protein [Virgisporangium aurantiacum]|uniref:DinB family protein n=1 Tax=Virgisporangium aurantiacum TaxID=175570 RepID=A0A8J3Z298_9ACTN|nr:hypothetical protein [Virgisporangium aurantiacum]GIJ55949.1 hypothetical protein Vau01_034650 [Virgisporangium aurantiacum]